eukprot:111662-Rhodomonas_salina.1
MDTTAYAVATIDAALVAFTIRDELDGVGDVWGMLAYQQTWSEAPIRMSRTKNSTFEKVEGLRGAQTVSVSPETGCGPEDPCSVAVRGGPPRDEVLCGANPLYAVWRDALSTAGKQPLPCQRISFTVVQTSTSNPDLFVVQPYLTQNGSLVFESAPTMSGNATFEVFLKDDGLATGWTAYMRETGYVTSPPDILTEILNPGVDVSDVQTFVIQVLSVNDPPLMVPATIELLQNSEPEDRYLIAQSITAGAPNEIQQELSLDWKWLWRARPNRFCEERSIVRSLLLGDFDTEQEALEACFDACDRDVNCNFVSFDNSILPCGISSICTLRTQPLNTMYETPRNRFTEEPVLSSLDIGGQLIAFASFRLHPCAVGSFSMRIIVSDDGSSSATRQSLNTADPVEVEFVVTPRNQPPIFSFVQDTITVTASTNTTTVASFLRGVCAGFGECTCGYTNACASPGGKCQQLEGTCQGQTDICQTVSFALEAVETVEGLRPSSTELFTTFEIDPVTGSMTFVLRQDWSGTYMVSIAALDDGNDKFVELGTNKSINQFRLVIEPMNQKVGFDPLVPLLVPETMEPGLVQVHPVFQNLSAGFGDINLDLFYNVTFTILEIECSSRVYTNFSCSDLFVSLPQFDRKGVVSFVLVPDSQGFVDINVQVNNTGPIPEGGFEAVQLTFQIADVNEAPTCDIVSEITVLENSGPVLLRGFIANISAGPEPESWQNIIFEIEANNSIPDLFASPPFVDATGGLRFETTIGRYGEATFLVTCIDDGGTAYSGINALPAVPVLFRVLPRPKVSTVHPAVGPILGGSIITVTGMHFGSEASRGYRSSFYDGVEVLVDGIQCRDTRFVSDEVVICVGSLPGNGLSDVQVRVSDEFGVNRVVTNLSRTGTAPDSFGSAAFLAAGKGMVGIVSRGPPPVLPLPPIDEVEPVDPVTPVGNASNFSLAVTAANFSVSHGSNISISSGGNVTGNMTGLWSILNASNRPLNLTNTSEDVLSYQLAQFAAALCRASMEFQNLTGIVLDVSALCPGVNSTQNSTQAPAWPIEYVCGLVVTYAEASQGANISVWQALSIPMADFLQICIPPAQEPMVDVNATLNITDIPLPEPEEDVEPYAQLEGLPVNVEGTIRSMMLFRGLLYLGGSFTGTSKDTSSNIVALGRANGENRADVMSVGNGVDGAVNAMTEYGGMLMLGGTFTKAAGTSGVSLRSGCLVAWNANEQTWNMVGRTPIQGAIYTMLVFQGKLFVAGRFLLTAGQE